MSSSEAITCSGEMFKEGKSPIEVAETMLDVAVDKGSKDNITVVVVKLG
jgi:serine/threonine protein phosphatase PrpC